jgi:hypothetical protein
MHGHINVTVHGHMNVTVYGHMNVKFGLWILCKLPFFLNSHCASDHQVSPSILTSYHCWSQPY